MKFPTPKSRGINPDVLTHIQDSQDWTLYHKSIREGSTGVGMTLEHLIRVPENNISGPDLFCAEMKAKRQESDALLTLFTKNPYRKVRALTLEYGTDVYDAKGNLDRRRLYHSIDNSNKSAAQLFKLEDAPGHLNLVDRATGKVVASWTYAALKKAMDKLTNLCLIDVKTRLIQGWSDKKEKMVPLEYFQYQSFGYFTGFNPQKFYEALLAGEVIVDLRAHWDYTEGKMRDHGTAFRLNPALMHDLYKRHKRFELLA